MKLNPLSGVLATLSCLSLAAQAQTTTLPSVTVTGNPLESTEEAHAVSELSGTALTLRAKSTLGETLDGLPGVSSTYFGPNASRPVIRGMDGDRIRILQNSGASLDASALSFDHAIANDPLSVERVEVLRGPGALLYGGSATGGVVNVLDGRIAREAIFDAQGGTIGRVDASLGSASRERSLAASLDQGTQRYNFHVDGFARRSDDVGVPLSLPCSKPGSASPASRICNSANQTEGLAVGNAWFLRDGFLGASLAHYQSDYGTVAEDEVTIGMHSTRLSLQGQQRNLTGPFTKVTAQFNAADYQHTEYEAGAAGTVFRNRGWDMRVEAQHQPMGAWHGVVGMQVERNRFAADGEEAFIPTSDTSQVALFLLEELRMGTGRWELGLRAERVQVESMGSADPGLTRLAKGARSFTPLSASVQWAQPLSGAWNWRVQLAATERAPKDYELFANGPHLATAAWEQGDATLGKEKSVNAEVELAWKSGGNRVTASVYASRFSSFIGLLATGQMRTTDGEVNTVDANLTDTRYAMVRAQFVGAELSGLTRLGKGAWGVLDWEWHADTTRAWNTATGEPLPRIAPLRVGSAWALARGPWSARLGFDHNAAQHRVPLLGQRVTNGYTLWNAALSYQVAGARSAYWYARLDNLTDQLAYSATSVLTSTAYPKAPLPGRNLKVGVTWRFQ